MIYLDNAATSLSQAAPWSSAPWRARLPAWAANPGRGQGIKLVPVRRAGLYRSTAGRKPLGC